MNIEQFHSDLHTSFGRIPAIAHTLDLGVDYLRSRPKLAAQ